MKFIVTKLVIRKYSYLILLVLTLPLFLTNLWQKSLFSFDEAWYAEIARNILKYKNLFLLTWNGASFIEHPPLGFWLMAISFKVLGISEFSARFPSALLGWGSVILTYLLGTKLFNKHVGFLSSLMLSSSVWFILRARTANLDVILTFFFLLAFYCAANINKKSYFLYGMMVSISLLLLVKTVVGLTIIPVVLFYLIKYKGSLKKKDIIFSLLLFLIITSPYFIINYFLFGITFIQRIISITLRGRIGDYSIHYQLPLFYIHMGIREWYYPAIISLLGNLFFINKNEVRVLFIFFLTFFFPFITSSKTEIWHLIPLYFVLGLMIFSFADNTRQIFVKYVAKKFRNLSLLLMLFGGIFLAGKQVVEFQKEIFSTKIPSTESIISEIASLYSEPLYITEYYYPEAVFYSKKNLIIIAPDKKDNNKEYLSVGNLFMNNNSFILLTTESVLIDSDIRRDEYELIAKVGNNILVKNKIN